MMKAGIFILVQFFCTVRSVIAGQCSKTSYEVLQVAEFLFIRVPESKFTGKISSKIYAKC
jgi:hypothetical protein